MIRLNFVALIIYAFKLGMLDFTNIIIDFCFYKIAINAFKIQWINTKTQLNLLLSLIKFYFNSDK